MVTESQSAGFGATSSSPEGRKFAPRAVAYVVDSIALFGINYAVGYTAGVVLVFSLILVGSIFGFVAELSESNLPLLRLLIGIALSVIYFATFEALYGATPGKLLLGMRVIDMDGKPPALDKALIRSAWRLIDGLFLGLVAASSMKPPLRQRLGDKRAQTLVVSSNSSSISHKPTKLRLLLAFIGYSFFSAFLQLVELIPAIAISNAR